MVERRLRLTILGGYLASGKTTGLRHLLHMAARPPWVLVNEAAEVAVHDHLIRAAEGVTVLARGCACCTGRRELVQALRGLCNMRSRGQGPDEAILETSGLADPAQILAAIRVIRVWCIISWWWARSFWSMRCTGWTNWPAIPWARARLRWRIDWS